MRDDPIESLFSTKKNEQDEAALTTKEIPVTKCLALSDK